MILHTEVPIQVPVRDLAQGSGFPFHSITIIGWITCTNHTPEFGSSSFVDSPFMFIYMYG